jgi:hypothetical protein
MSPSTLLPSMAKSQIRSSLQYNGKRHPLAATKKSGFPGFESRFGRDPGIRGIGNPGLVGIPGFGESGIPICPGIGDLGVWGRVRPANS